MPLRTIRPVRLSLVKGCRTLPLEIEMTPVPPSDRTNTPKAERVHRPSMSQDFRATGHSQQAVQGSGIQNIYFEDSRQMPESSISLAPPFGQRNDRLPIRGRNELLSEFEDSGNEHRVWIIHGLGGCGKTRFALEAAFASERRGADVWWISATDAGTLIAG